MQLQLKIGLPNLHALHHDIHLHHIRDLQQQREGHPD
jgi:hypothetical protein